MATTYLTRTFQSGGSVVKWTFSAWVKKTSIGGSDNTIFSRYQSSDYYTKVGFGSDQLFFYQRHAGSFAGTLESTQKFRDVNGWYHFVFVWDSGNATADDRMKMYVNGVQITDIASRTNPSQDLGSTWNTAFSQEIGRFNSTDYWKGYMTHINFCDGYAYSPTDFGEFDSNGVWTIKTSPSVSYGTTGFNILKDGNTITDSSANTNNWTLGGGTLTDDKDSPSNVFDTYNQLTIIGADPTLSNGSTTVSSTTGNHWRTTNNNIGMSSGKYYWETKVGTISGGNYCRLGVVSENLISTLTTSAFQGDYAYGINWDGSKLVNSSQSSYTTMATGDIFMFALDLDNNFIYGGKNGTWVNSGDPTSGASGTNALSAVQSGQTYFISGSIYQSSQDTNFGNGYFGTAAISSAENPDNGYGAFEYDVPAGYKALCTKSLNGE